MSEQEPKPQDALLVAKLVLTLQEADKMLESVYYRAGWDEQQRINPLREKIKKLLTQLSE